MGSTVFRLPSGVIKPSGYCPQVLDMSSGILNPVDALGINVSTICSALFLVWPLGSRPWPTLVPRHHLAIPSIDSKCTTLLQQYPDHIISL